MIFKKLGNRAKFILQNTNTAWKIILVYYLLDEYYLSLELGTSAEVNVVSHKTHTKELVMFVFNVLNFTATLLPRYFKVIFYA